MRGDPNQTDSDSHLTRRVSIAVSALAAVAIAAHLIWPRLKIDFVAVALLAFGTLPWLRGIVSSITWPGGPSISLWERRERVTAREERAASDAVQAIGTAATGAERLSEIFQLAGQYETLRRETPSGDQRTHEMSGIARQMLSLLPIAELDVPAELLSPGRGTGWPPTWPCCRCPAPRTAGNSSGRSPSARASPTTRAGRCGR